MKGGRNSKVGRRILALHIVNLGLIPGISMFPLPPPGVIPEDRTRSNHWEPHALPQNKTKILYLAKETQAKIETHY